MFGFAVSVGKTQNNCNKKTNVENGKGRQHSNLPHNRWSISGIRFKAIGVGPLPPELARAHGLLPHQSLPQLTAPSPSLLSHPSTAWGHGQLGLTPSHCPARSLSSPCVNLESGGCPQWPLGQSAPALLCTTTICRAGTEQRTGRKGKERKKERKRTVETLCSLVSVHETPKEDLVLLVNLVLEYVQVVRGCHSDDVLRGVPGCVQDLFAKVQTVHTDLVFPALSTHADLAGFEDGTGFAVLPRRLQRHVALGVAVEHAEKVVVGASHDDTATGKDRWTDDFHAFSEANCR